MLTLFDTTPTFPEGFTYYPNFINAAEETSLLAEVTKVKLHEFVFQGHLAKRRVASFGYDYSFTNRSLSKGADIPETFSWLIERIAQQALIPQSEIAELLVTEYPPGALINWHRDAPPFDVIAGISLKSDCTFRLRPQEKSLQLRKNLISFPIAARSMYIMRGPARTDWQHSTTAVSDTRYSITIRTLK